MDLENLTGDGIGNLFGLADYMDDVKDLAILGASAAAGVVVGNAVIAKAPWVKNQSPTVKAGALGVLGIVLGIGLGRYVHRGVGAGVGAGLLGAAIGQIAAPYIAKIPGFAGLGTTEELLLGLGGDYANDYQPIPGQMNGVSDYQPMPGQVGDLSTFIQ